MPPDTPRITIDAAVFIDKCLACQTATVSSGTPATRKPQAVGPSCPHPLVGKDAPIEPSSLLLQEPPRPHRRRRPGQCQGNST